MTDNLENFRAGRQQITATNPKINFISAFFQNASNAGRQ